MPSRWLRTRILVFCLALACRPLSIAQNVTTWHNDNNRTGWQQNETQLTQSSVNQTNFGLLWQWGSPAAPLKGSIYAQPLAVAAVPTNFSTCSPSCDLVFVATERDMLYAFKATSNSQTPVWSLDLAQSLGGSAVDCTQDPQYPPCGLFTYVGITGTPAIDANGGSNTDTLYVVAAVNVSNRIGFYLFAVDITKGTVLGHTQITGTVSGHAPSQHCISDYPTPGQLQFESDSNHIQRSGLLLLNGNVYVAFSSGPGNPGEVNNGWMFEYSFSASSGTFTRQAIFATTPWGTGGGIWMSGAAPASDGNYIYVATANGTTFDPVTQNIPFDLGDSLLQLQPDLIVNDYYAPPDAGQTRCATDVDFGSGGVLLPPDFTYTCQVNGCQCRNGCRIAVNADKESNLYVASQSGLGKFTGNNIQVIATPSPLEGAQGYWASPAYWHYNNGQDHYWLYYSATTDKQRTEAPLPINGYQLLANGSAGPIPTTYISSATLFCQYSPTPSGSWNEPSGDATTGIVWAIEQNPNSNNPILGNCNGQSIPHAILHAFNATTLAEIYTSINSVRTTDIGKVSAFPTPTIFKGQVYMGTHTEVDVFGLCSTNGSSGCLP